jgi:surface-anchored protein/MYXO-CTERM domain-containing protein
MKNSLIRFAALSATLGLPAMGQVFFTSEHVDLGFAYEDGILEPHWHDETNEIEYEPDGASVMLRANTQETAPGAGAFGFLGNAGAPFWLLPSSQDPNKVFLGIAAEEIESGIFVGNTIRLDLVSVTGPGHFIAYSVSGLGVPNTFWNTRDGVTDADTVIAVAGGHTDYNWAFTALGDYVVSVRATGTLVGGGVVTSEVGNFQFTVVPEPHEYAALAGAGLAAFALWRRRTSR